MALRFARRSLTVPQLAHWFTILSFLVLDIAQDITNANRFALNFKCAVLPDIRAFVTSGARIRQLTFLSCIAVPIDNAPARTQSLGHSNGEEPMLFLYFSTPDDTTGRDGSVSVVYPLSQSIMDYMASAPTESVRSVCLGKTIVPLVKDNIPCILE